MTTTHPPTTETGESWVDPATNAITWHCASCSDHHTMRTLDNADEFNGRAIVQ